MAERLIYRYERTLQDTNGLRDAAHSLLPQTPPAVSGPRVSCLMVTRGDIRMVRPAVRQFQRQSYRERELVIVCDAVSPELADFLAGCGELVRLVTVEAGQPLGRLRNISVAQARGDIVAQWDDDDLYSPQRLANAVGTLLHAEADALFVRQWMVWWPARRSLSLASSRAWEGTMVAFKRAIAAYPELTHAEDTVMVDRFIGRHVVAIVDDPRSYCYCIHGQNTYHDEHMQGIINGAKLHFDYETGMRALAADFDFLAHPANGEPAYTQASPDREARRLDGYLGRNQILRKLKAAAGIK